MPQAALSVFKLFVREFRKPQLMDLQEVRKVATLARLRMTDEELADCGRQLTAILDYVQLLDEVDIDGVEPMPHAVELQNVFREDAVRESLLISEALGNAPLTDGRCFLVPPILEEKAAGSGR